MRHHDPQPRSGVSPALLLLAVLTGCAPGFQAGRLLVPLRPEQPEGAAVKLYWELRGRPIRDEVPSLLVFHGGPGAPEHVWLRASASRSGLLVKA